MSTGRRVVSCFADIVTIFTFSVILKIFFLVLTVCRFCQYRPYLHFISWFLVFFHLTTMNPAWLLCLLLCAFSFASRDSFFQNECSTDWFLPLPPLSTGFSFDSSLSPSLNILPVLHVCCNRKLLPLPRIRPTLSF